MRVSDAMLFCLREKEFAVIFNNISIRIERKIANICCLINYFSLYTLQNYEINCTHNLPHRNVRAWRKREKAIKYNLYCSNLAFKKSQLKFTIKNVRECARLVYSTFFLPLLHLFFPFACNTCFAIFSIQKPKDFTRHK